MARIGLLLLVLLIGAGAVFGLSALNAAPGSKPQQPATSQEVPLSVTASAAKIDQHQPQHFKTATFALG